MLASRSSSTNLLAEQEMAITLDTAQSQYLS